MNSNIQFRPCVCVYVCVDMYIKLYKVPRSFDRCLNTFISLPCKYAKILLFFFSQLLFHSKLD